MSKGEHVVAMNTPSGGYRFECKHCGAFYEPALPCPLNVFTAAMGAFEKMHGDCPAPVVDADAIASR